MLKGSGKIAVIKFYLGWNSSKNAVLPGEPTREAKSGTKLRHSATRLEGCSIYFSTFEAHVKREIKK